MNSSIQFNSYQKDEEQEKRLIELNALLAPLEQQLTEDLTEPQLPQVFIVGPPRSGSTLVGQLLAHWGGFGYISNFLARFYMAPGVGARIERTLDINNTMGQPDYVSDHARTKGWHEPHEFGYFWARWFNQGQETHKLSNEALSKICTPDLLKSLASIESVYQSPMVYKNNTWFTFHIEFLSHLIPNSVFVICNRELIYVAQSIYQARLKLAGDQSQWWSLCPPEYRDLLDKNWDEQIAGQIYYTIKHMEEGLRNVSNRRVIRAPYEAICENPTSFCRSVVDAVMQLGGDVPTVGYAPERLESTNRQRIDDDVFNILQKSISAYFE